MVHWRAAFSNGISFDQGGFAKPQTKKNLTFLAFEPV
jgi:hypothetical protein